MDVARTEVADAELVRMIEFRADREPHRDEKEELWKESVRLYNASREEEIRAAWCEYHQGQVERLKAVLEALIASHAERAEMYRDQPKGVA